MCVCECVSTRRKKQQQKQAHALLALARTSERVCKYRVSYDPSADISTASFPHARERVVVLARAQRGRGTCPLGIHGTEREREHRTVSLRGGKRGRDRDIEAMVNHLRERMSLTPQAAFFPHFCWLIDFCKVEHWLAGFSVKIDVQGMRFFFFFLLKKWIILISILIKTMNFIKLMRC